MDVSSILRPRLHQCLDTSGDQLSLLWSHSSHVAMVTLGDRGMDVLMAGETLVAVTAAGSDLSASRCHVALGGGAGWHVRHEPCILSQEKVTEFFSGFDHVSFSRDIKNCSTHYTSNK